ncbi:MAG: response regulator [Proteobacteria bacterium]|nr:response regulator [Pseudomonadota bacterium]
MVRLTGTMPPDGKPPKFDHILLVDDIARNTQSSLETIRRTYEGYELTVHITHTFAEALAAFNLHDIKLVILDLDLNDMQGDGATLLKEFREKKPELTVLANSSEQKYNDILVKGGAIAVLAKDSRKLKRWLAING